MTAFWTAWIVVLVVFNMGVSLFLFIWGQKVPIPTAPDGTSGHTWAHGVLREGVRRLPLWWAVLSAALFVAAFGYLALYPSLGNYRGLLGWTSVGEWQQDIAANGAKLDPLLAAIHEGSVEELAKNRAVVSMGGRLFLDNCAACHGTEAAGNQTLGAPNLMDADWLYGGDPETILKTILDGRKGTMPPWGPALGPDGVVDVSAYVRSLGGAEEPAGWVEAGKQRFTAMCVGCHGIDGRGNPALGAPNLTDDVWLYGGDLASVGESIREGRGGVMPAWRARLGEDQAKAVAAWVYAASEESSGRDERAGDAARAARERGAASEQRVANLEPAGSDER